MPNTFRRITVFTFLWFASTTAPAVETVTIHPKSGRPMQGEVDERTDDVKLWLRLTEQRVIVRRPFEWDAIDTAMIGERSVTVDELKAQVPDLTEPLAETFFDLSEEEVRQRRVFVRPERVKSVWTSAVPSNWDYDAEIDGLELCIVPLSDSQTMIPVRGQISVTLIGREYRYGAESDFVKLQRWSLPIRAEDFDDRCGTIRLPFLRIHPEKDAGISNIAMLHVELTVFGQGRFESETPVQLRTYNPIRSEMLRLGDRPR